MADNQGLPDNWGKKQSERKNQGRKKKTYPEKLKITHFFASRIEIVLITILQETQNDNLAITKEEDLLKRSK